MNKVLFISDFFATEMRGGAEIYDDILITMLKEDGVKVVSWKTNQITDKHIRLYRNCGFHTIVSNFCLITKPTAEELIAHPGTYSILEHDHKYIKGRNPSVYENFEVPPQHIINRVLYANAKNVFAQSSIHAEVIQKNLKINNVINLGMSLWTDEQLSVIEKNLNVEKEDVVSIINSSNPTKNTLGTVEYCEDKKLQYKLIGSTDYEEYITQLAACSTYAYIPRVLETFNRVLLEARMLDCRLLTTNLNGCISEAWFKEHKGQELIDYVRTERPRIYGDIKNALFNPRAIERGDNITVILNAYRRPYNLKMQIDAIRAQTAKAAQIWLWVNAHEDNEGYDFNSLDVDRIFHNDYNWKFYGRFAAALLADTEYIAIFDDDTVPGSKWFENCLNTMETHEGILGSAGIILHGNRYVQHERCGWPSQNAETTEVDLVGHAWFFKREWLKYLWQEKPTTWDNGEDIQFAFMAKIHGGIPTYCPPHPNEDLSMHGSIMGNELGIDEKATSTNSAVSHQQFFNERDVCVQTGIEKGWKTVRGVKL